MTTNKNLLPCLHCGSQARLEYADDIPCHISRVCVQCTNCGARGPMLPVWIDSAIASNLLQSIKNYRMNPDAARKHDPAGDKAIEEMVATFEQASACAAELWNRHKHTSKDCKGKVLAQAKREGGAQ